PLVDLHRVAGGRGGAAVHAEIGERDVEEQVPVQVFDVGRLRAGRGGAAGGVLDRNLALHQPLFHAALSTRRATTMATIHPHGTGWRGRSVGARSGCAAACWPLETGLSTISLSMGGRPIPPPPLCEPPSSWQHIKQPSS